MKTDEWQKVKDIFLAALEHEAETRGAFLDEACGGQVELRQEVDALLASHEEAASFIERPALNVAEAMRAHAAPRVGQHVGPYKIVREIGHGGMGAVFLAERDDAEFTQQAAVKFVRYGIEAEEVTRRFRHERQILAALNHPNIARLLDGGTDDDGQPYFVMEYVAGAPLLDYCEQKSLSLNERLALFRKICAAVQHAHQHLVIHRDLKPSNILVGDDGEPKLLDFGIAKLLDAELSGPDWTQTDTALQLLTPEYASPEQILGQPVSTATDVYSLGVILYELLTGQRPYRLKTGRPGELARAISEEEPPAPSKTEGEKERKGEREKNHLSPTIPPSTQLPFSPSALRGDLDNIALMALRKEPARRYSSVGQFSEDVRRYLDGLPVIARTDAFSYRAAKFVTRHKAGVAAAVLVMLSLVVGLLATLWQARAARQERDRARAAQVKAERINKFLQDTLGAPDPTKEGREVKVLDVLAKAAQRAESEFAAQPEVLAEVKRTIGRTFYSLEFYEQAGPMLRDALKIYRVTYGENHPATATCLRDWANVLVYQDQTAEAIPHLQQAVTAQRQNPPDNKSEFAETLISLGAAYYYQGDENAKKQALQIYAEAVAYCRQNLPPDDPQLAIALNELANVSDNETAVALYRQSIAILRRRPELKTELATHLANLGSTLYLVGQYDETETVLRESLQIKRGIFGADSPQASIILTYLSRSFYARGDYPQAVTNAREAVRIQQQKLPAGHRDFHASFGALGRALLKNGKFAEAEKYLRQAHDLMLERYGADDERVKNVAGYLAECLRRQAK